MTKKNTAHAAALRATADAAVVTWRELDATAKTKRDAANAFTSSLPADRREYAPREKRRALTSDLRTAELHREALEAEDAAERAQHAASAALDACELAEGDELALSRDPKGLLDDLAALDTEEAALRTKLAGVESRRKERRASAFQSEAKQTASRVAAGLPRSLPLPPFAPFVPVGVVPFLTALAERAEHGAPVPSKAAAIASARADENRICADLEEWRLHDEAIAKEKEERAASLRREAEDANKRMATQAKEGREAAEAEKGKREKLAADFKARRAGGARS